MDDELKAALDQIRSVLDRVDQRLGAIESNLEQVDGLREKIEHERKARRELAEQTSWLVELLGDSSNELQWRRDEMKKAEGDSA